MISEELLQKVREMCAGKENIKFTVAVMQEDRIEKRLFGCDGAELPYEEYHYEIGSLTKTFTAALLAKAIKEGAVSLEDRLDKYIPELEKGRIYPTLKRLATHTSGYPADTREFDEEFTKNDGKNLYNRYTYETMLEVIDGIRIEDRDYEAQYSNFGIGVLGTVIEKAFGKSFHDLMEELLSTLDLKETFPGLSKNGSMDIEGYDMDNKSTGNLLWNRDCIIGAAGYLFSTAGDLLKYARCQMEDSTGYLHLCHNNLAPYQREGVSIDVGLCWMLIPEYQILWHNGGTKSFHTILCINKEKNTAVAFLCNYMIEEVSTAALHCMIGLTGEK